MSEIYVPELKPHERLLDTILSPVMRLTHGNKIERCQETHPWHAIDVAPEDLNMDLAITVAGSENAKSFIFKNSKLPFFHFPALGGWKNYLVLGPTGYNPDNLPRWHIGWQITGANGILSAQVHRLPIYDPQIKVLMGTSDILASFFIINPDGCQVPIDLIDDGVLNDQKYPDTRLF